MISSSKMSQKAGSINPDVQAVTELTCKEGKHSVHTG